MRSGESQQLRPKDVDLDGGWIHIVSREGAETKTGQSRKVPTHSRLRVILESVPKENGTGISLLSPAPNTLKVVIT
jgi:integrase